ncbi:MAG: DUF922 domain-containing protein [Paracoccaceae bacterium]
MNRLALLITCLASPACVALALGAGAASADTYDDADITVTTYTVDGETLGDIETQMTAEGPQGFWAYTTWTVNWNDACETTVNAAITLPELAEDTALSDADAEEFARMRAALEAHELQHVEIGLAYAAETEAQGCPTAFEPILDTFLADERAFDAETEHGRTQGVYLTAD